MTTLKEILHTLAEGISLTGPAREQLHADIDAHDQADDVSRETGDDPEADVSRETAPSVPAGRPVPRSAGAQG